MTGFTFLGTSPTPVVTWVVALFTSFPKSENDFVTTLGDVVCVVTFLPIFLVALLGSVIVNFFSIFG